MNFVLLSILIDNLNSSDVYLYKWQKGKHYPFKMTTYDALENKTKICYLRKAINIQEFEHCFVQIISGHLIDVSDFTLIELLCISPLFYGMKKELPETSEIEKLKKRKFPAKNKDLFMFALDKNYGEFVRFKDNKYETINIHQLTGAEENNYIKEYTEALMTSNLMILIFFISLANKLNFISSTTRSEQPLLNSNIKDLFKQIPFSTTADHTGSNIGIKSGLIGVKTPTIIGNSVLYILAPIGAGRLSSGADPTNIVLKRAQSFENPREVLCCVFKLSPNFFTSLYSVGRYIMDEETTETFISVLLSGESWTSTFGKDSEVNWDELMHMGGVIKNQDRVRELVSQCINSPNGNAAFVYLSTLSKLDHLPIDYLNRKASYDVISHLYQIVCLNEEVIDKAFSLIDSLLKTPSARVHENSIKSFDNFRRFLSIDTNRLSTNTNFLIYCNRHLLSVRNVSGPAREPGLDWSTDNKANSIVLMPINMTVQQYENSIYIYYNNSGKVVAKDKRNGFPIGNDSDYLTKKKSLYEILTDTTGIKGELADNIRRTFDIDQIIIDAKPAPRKYRPYHANLRGTVLLAFRDYLDKYASLENPSDTRDNGSSPSTSDPNSQKIKIMTVYRGRDIFGDFHVDIFQQNTGKGKMVPVEILSQKLGDFVTLAMSEEIIEGHYSTIEGIKDNIDNLRAQLNSDLLSLRSDKNRIQQEKPENYVSLAADVDDNIKDKINRFKKIEEELKEKIEKEEESINATEKRVPALKREIIDYFTKNEVYGYAAFQKALQASETLQTKLSSLISRDEGELRNLSGTLETNLANLTKDVTKSKEYINARSKILSEKREEWLENRNDGEATEIDSEELTLTKEEQQELVEKITSRWKEDNIKKVESKKEELEKKLFATVTFRDLVDNQYFITSILNFGRDVEEFIYEKISPLPGGKQILDKGTVIEYISRYVSDYNPKNLSNYGKNMSIQEANKEISRFTDEIIEWPVLTVPPNKEDLFKISYILSKREEELNKAIEDAKNSKIRNIALIMEAFKIRTQPKLEYISFIPETSNVLLMVPTLEKLVKYNKGYFNVEPISYIDQASKLLRFKILASEVYLIYHLSLDKSLQEVSKWILAPLHHAINSLSEEESQAHVVMFRQICSILTGRIKNYLRDKMDIKWINNADLLAPVDLLKLASMNQKSTQVQDIHLDLAEILSKNPKNKNEIEVLKEKLKEISEVINRAKGFSLYHREPTPENHEVPRFENIILSPLSPVIDENKGIRVNPKSFIARDSSSDDSSSGSSSDSD